MGVDSSLYSALEAESSKYQQNQELACRVQDASKEQAFQVKFSCAPIYLNATTDTWPNEILFHCFNTQESTIEAHTVCVNKLEHPGAITKSTA